MFVVVLFLNIAYKATNLRQLIMPLCIQPLAKSNVVSSITAIVNTVLCRGETFTVDVRVLSFLHRGERT